MYRHMNEYSTQLIYQYPKEYIFDIEIYRFYIPCRYDNKRHIYLGAGMVMMYRVGAGTPTQLFGT